MIEKNMALTILTTRRVFTMVSVVALSLLLGGCLGNRVQSGPALTIKAIESPILGSDSDDLTEMPVSGANLKSSLMSGQTMYQIMVAELLVQEKHPVEAYKLLQPLAVKTQDPGLAERVFELSMNTLDMAEIAKSAALLKKVAPNNPSGWRASFLLSAAQGKTSKAVREWQTYISLTKAPLAEQFMPTAKKIVQAAKKQPGLAFLSVLAQKYPRQKAAIYALAVAAYSYHDFALAQKTLWQAEKLYDEKTAPIIYQNIHNYLAGTYLSLKQSKEGLVKLKPYLQAHLQDWGFQQNYARLELGAGQLLQAERRYQLIIKHNPSDKAAHFALALILMEEKKIQAAKQILEALVKNAAYQDSAYYYLGRLYKMQQDNAQALSAFRQVKAGGFLVDAQVNQAEIEYHAQGLAKTILFLDAALAKQANNPLAQLKLWHAKAIFFQDARDFKEAIKAYDEVLKLNPKNTNILFKESIIFYDQKDFARYVDRLQKILAMNPRQADALNALGYYYLEEEHNLAKAKTLIDKALAVSPKAYYILDSKGWLLYQQQDYLAAEKVLKQAFDNQVDDEVLIHWLKTLWRLKKYSQAKALWRRYAPKFPDNVELQSLMSSLKLK